MLFTQSPVKARATPERQRIDVFPMNTVLNAVCSIQTPPLDGNMIQQLKKNLTRLLERTEQPQCSCFFFPKSSTVHNPFAPQVELCLS